MNIEQSKAFWLSQMRQDQEKLQPQSETSYYIQKTIEPFQIKEPIKTGSQLPAINLIQNHITRMEENLQNKVNWNSQDEDILFRIHQEQGNKWSSIATQVGNRTQNCVKNKFYSTLRKGFRKINKYIANIRRKTHATEMSNNKLIKPDFLTKLSAIADRNHEQKYEVKQMAIDISRELEHELIVLARNRREYQKNEWTQEFQFQQHLLHQVFQFRKNCKKRKGKRKNVASDHHSSKDDESQEEMVGEEKDFVEEQQIGENKVSSKNQIKTSEQIGGLKVKTKESLERSVIFKPPEKIQKIQRNEERVVSGEPETMLRGEGEQGINLFSEHSISPKNSLCHIIDASPHYSKFSSFGNAFINNISKVEISAQISQNSDYLKEVPFIDRIPVQNSEKGMLFFKSSQLNKVNQSNNYNLEQSKNKMYMSQAIEAKQPQTKLVRQESIHASSIITENTITKKDLSKVEENQRQD